MSTARAEITIDALTVAEAEALWYDQDSWPLFIDGLRSVVSVDGQPPQVGSITVWRSGPAGRGTVTETVIDYRPGSGQRLEVEDDAIQAQQSVQFSATGSSLTIALELDYTLRGNSPFRMISDWLFIRRAEAESLRRTLAAFAAELEQREI